MPEKYDAIVIGTGFGGTVAALRLFEKKKKVLVLERGTWWITPEKLGKPPVSALDPIPVWAKKQPNTNRQPVQYWPRPDHKAGLLDFFASVRLPTNDRGLYNYSIFKQAHILTASGVGGGSLIYSNVTLRPENEVLAHIALNLADNDITEAYKWMARYRGKLSQIVTKIPLPKTNVANLDSDPVKGNDYLYLDRSRLLKYASEQLTKLGIELPLKPWKPLDLSIIEYEPSEDPADPQKRSDADKAHTFCERQGRCMLGCLPAARHTLNKTLYKEVFSKPDSGITLSPRCEVRHINRLPNGDYEVTYRDHRDDERKTVQAPLVFLAGGTLGTAEILLRSRERNHLPLSKTLGEGFSTNGDFGAFVFGTVHPVYSTRGPINTCEVQFKKDGLNITVEDCAIPAMFAAITSTALNVLDNFAKCQEFKNQMTGAFTQMKLPDLRDFFPHLPDPRDPTSSETEAEMVADIFFFNAMGQDEPAGKFTLKDNNLDLDWAQPVASQPIFGKIETVLKALAERMRRPDQDGQPGGRYLPLPLWKGLGNKILTVTHPLGGCRIGPTNSDGVVDDFGRVYDGSKPPGSKDVLPGLYIVDGSVIPGALAANPTLTIVAQAIKTVNNALPLP